MDAQLSPRIATRRVPVLAGLDLAAGPREAPPEGRARRNPPMRRAGFIISIFTFGMAREIAGMVATREIPALRSGEWFSLMEKVWFKFALVSNLQ
jgi:hypothetical protein